MAYSEDTAQRVRNTLKTHKNILEKKMFGGLCFMMNGNMVCGVNKDNILFRVNPNDKEKLSNDGVRPMVHNGREMKGFLYVTKSEYKTDKDLKTWINRSISFIQTLPAKKKKIILL